jgi:hypothetical protein
MKIDCYPDFDHIYKAGDRLIIEQTVYPTDTGALAIKMTRLVLVPAGSEKGRSIIFVDTDPPLIISKQQIDERGEK